MAAALRRHRRPDRSDGVTEDPVQAYIRFSAPANLAGLPALSVPCGVTAAGLPIGLQVVGGAFGEAAVLRVGHACQSAVDWRAWPPRLDPRGVPAESVATPAVGGRAAYPECD
nr:amidase family protein [Mycobacterium palustre]